MKAQRFPGRGNHKRSVPMLDVVSTATWEAESRKVTVSSSPTWATKRTKGKASQPASQPASQQARKCPKAVVCLRSQSEALHDRSDLLQACCPLVLGPAYFSVIHRTDKGPQGLPQRSSCDLSQSAPAGSTAALSTDSALILDGVLHHPQPQFPNPKLHILPCPFLLPNSVFTFPNIMNL